MCLCLDVAWLGQETWDQRGEELVSERARDQRVTPKVVVSGEFFNPYLLPRLLGVAAVPWLVSLDL